MIFLSIFQMQLTEKTTTVYELKIGSSQNCRQNNTTRQSVRRDKFLKQKITTENPYSTNVKKFKRSSNQIIQSTHRHQQAQIHHNSNFEKYKSAPNIYCL